MMYEKLIDLGLNLTSEQQILLDKFADIFLEINTKINLISKGDAQLLFEKHIYDSLALNLFCKKYGIVPNNILDIGTGGGFPSIPVSLIYKNTHVTAIDSVNKKINAINKIKQLLELDNLLPICSRIEDIEKKNFYDVVVSRAVSELRVILEYAIPYVKTGGYFIAYKSKKADEEISHAEHALKILNSEIVDKIEYSLPINEENKRVLLIIVKKADVSDIYPRKNGNINKRPL